MERLVYSPKVYAWTLSDGYMKGNEPFNLSEFIVNGSVTRRINAASSAELVIRNPDMRFTKGVSQGRPFFRPMDPITVWASRLDNYPVQLFTGYLDRTPYVQLYPGTCALTATCTLKRLLHTYWDPALPYVESFMQYYGWTANRQTGMLENFEAQLPNVYGKAEGQSASQIANIPEFGKRNTPEFTDGSIGRLMFAVLEHVGGWDPKTIKIDKLPPELINELAAIYYAFQEDAQEIKGEFEYFLKKLIGEGTLGDGSGGSGPLDPGGEGPPSRTIVKPEDVGFSMLRAGFPADPEVIAAGIATVGAESTFGAGCADDGWGLNDYGCCAGYWQIYLSVHNVSMECANNLDCSSKIAYNIWKSAGGCFACKPGPNPWQGGTDSAPRYIDLAKRIIEAARNQKTEEKQKDEGPNVG